MSKEDPSFSEIITDLYDSITDRADEIRALRERVAHLEGEAGVAAPRLCDPRIVEFEPPWEERFISELRSLRKEIVGLRKDITRGNQGARNRR